MTNTDDLYLSLKQKEKARLQPAHLGVIMKKEYKKEQYHFMNRMLLTYIYVLLIRKTVNLFEMSDIKLLHAQVQARAGKSRDGIEGAHMLLREIAMNGVPLYNLKIFNSKDNNEMPVPDGLKGALVYCAAQVTLAPSIYNRADQLIEEPRVVMEEYISLVQKFAIERSDTRRMREELFDGICRLFNTALAQIPAFTGTVSNPKEPTKAEGASLKGEYTSQANKFLSYKNGIVKKDTEEWMRALRLNGGWDSKKAKKFDKSMGQKPEFAPFISEKAANSKLGKVDGLDNLADILRKKIEELGKK